MNIRYVFALLFLYTSGTALKANGLLDNLQSFVSACYHKPFEMGTIAPCSDSVGHAISLYVKPGMRCLEIGSGPGNLTLHIAEALQGKGLVDAVEINEDLCKIARENLKQYDMVTVRCCSILDWQPVDYKYDVVICTLPFNYFSQGFTAEIINHVKNLITPEATFSYVEYLLLGKIKSIFLLGNAKKNFTALQEYLFELQQEHLIASDDVYLNVPPLRIYHLALLNE